MACEAFDGNRPVLRAVLRVTLFSGPSELDRLLADGAERARAAASETMEVVRTAMNLA